MEIRTFKSTNVVSASYDPATASLTVTFDGDRRYQYDRVPASVWKSLKKAASPGHFVNSHLNQYGYRRV